jgi:hypothetical protein
LGDLGEGDVDSAEPLDEARKGVGKEVVEGIGLVDFGFGFVVTGGGAWGVAAGTEGFE